MGWPKKYRYLIDSPYNLFLVCSECHLNKALPSREEFWMMACRRYGEPAVREWYDSLPFKGPRPNYATSGAIQNEEGNAGQEG